MLKYHHVLLATCLTPTCQHVALRAQEIAKESNAKLSVIHVLEQTAAAYGGEFSTALDIEYEQELETQVKKALDNLAEGLAIPADQRYFQTGSIKHCVIDTAEKIDADLIVVGSHSHHGIELLLGSRANAILHKATSDVLAVRVNDQ